MKPRILSLKELIPAVNSAIALALCLALVVSGDSVAFATVMQPPQEAAAAADPKIPNDQLDSLVAPIALYPDPLLSQILVASTYPLEIVQLYQWMQKNSKMPQDKMVEEVKKQDWDPSIQAMVVLPDLVKNLNDSIKWTTDLGNAFLAQQGDVMDAVQRMRAKAKSKGNLKSTEQQKVETKVIESKEYIVIQPTKTEVVYVPSYEPTVVYGAPVYPYPAYPYPPPGYYAAGAAVAFGVGMMVGAAWGGGYGWNSGWGGSNNTININNSNNFVNNSNRQNVQGGNRNQARPSGGSSSWQHNPQHRGGTPYGNKATANKFGGTARGDSMSARQNSARQNQAAGGGRQQSSGFGGDRAGSAGSRGGDRGASAGTMGSNRGGGGDRGLSSGSSSRGGGTFGSGGSSRSSSMASSSRGSSSMSRGGGGGGGRSGGGGRRR